MKMIVPMEINGTTLTDSNLAEDDVVSAYNAGTTYAAGEYAYSATTHRIYRSVQGSNTGNDPTTDDGTWWVDYSATNKWKPFDQNIGDAATSTGDITFEFTASQKCTHLALFGLGAAEVSIVVKNLAAATTYTATQAVIDASEIVDWYSFFTEEPTFETEVLFEDIPLFSGYTLELTIGDGTGATSVGQIVLGKNNNLGTTLDGTEVGFTDFSIKEQDEFGNLSITERGFSDTVDFQFAVPTTDVRRVKRLLTRNRATPCVFWAGSGMLNTGTFVYGFFDDTSFPLSSGGMTFATLDIKGLT